MNTVKRVAMVIGIREDRLQEYKEIHADSHPGVRNLASAAHIHNFSIFATEMPDGRPYLFGYYEYDGPDYETDMSVFAAKPRNTEWLAMTDPMQIPFPGESSRNIIEEIYHSD